MEKDVIKQIILRQQDFISQVRLLPRELEIEANGNYVFIGIRRAGKTYLLYQYIQELLRDGHIKQEILFINFEDERIADIRKDELYLLLECYKELFAYDPIIFWMRYRTWRVGSISPVGWLMRNGVCLSREATLAC